MIADLVRQVGTVSVEELCTKFTSSAETIRRDLNALADVGKVKKIHGGATTPLTVGEGPFQQRLRNNVAAKRGIAKKAAAIVSPGQTIFVDTGTTTLTFAEEISDIEGITVVTNSLEIARYIGLHSRASLRLFVLGGEYNADNRETFGQECLHQLRSFRAHHAFITVGCVDAEAGATDFNFEEAQLARAMIARSKRVVMLADASKFDRIAGYEVGPLGKFDSLVSDTEPGPALMQALQRNAVEVI
ncbi:MAG: DeoR/GlpR family DNA-binding transcription regulator [Arenicellales bacterium]